MTTRNHRARFMANNYTPDATITYSSQQTAYPISNLLDSKRSAVAKFGGNFTVTASNKTLYINDGSDKTVTLTEGSYTYATLAAHVATRLNASSSNWTCTYDLAGGTFKFTIGHTGAATLRFSQTTAAAWDMLGYTGSGDVTATSWVADEQRNHTEEWIQWDFTLAREIGFFALIGELTRPFGVSDLADVRIQANASATWTSPTVDEALDPHDLGLMRFLDDLDDQTFRYVRYYLKDRLNTAGPLGFEMSHAYVGDYATLTETNVSRGFGVQHVDPSDEVESFGGVPYFHVKPMFRVFSDIQAGLLPETDRETMRELFRDVGRHTPFYASLDPLAQIGTDLQELTAYVRFAGDPNFKHTHHNYFSWSLALEEVR